MNNFEADGHAFVIRLLKFKSQRESMFAIKMELNLMHLKASSVKAIKFHHSIRCVIINIIFDSLKQKMMNKYDKQKN